MVRRVRKRNSLKIIADSFHDSRANVRRFRPILHRPATARDGQARQAPQASGLGRLRARLLPARAERPRLRLRDLQGPQADPSRRPNEASARAWIDAQDEGG